MNCIMNYQGFFILLAALSYYIYNDRMFAYIDMFTGKALPKWKSRIVTYIVNYAVFMIISRLKFYLIINWTIFAIFLVLEMLVLYRLSLPMGLFCGIQGAMAGLAINFITRSGAAILTGQSLAAFDSRVNTAVVNLKSYPISAGFILAGLGFHFMQKRFKDWNQQEENLISRENLRFSLYFVFSLFIYLDLNLLIYFTPGNEIILKLWGMKSGICVLIGYYIGISHIYTLSKLLHFERQSYFVRQELVSHKILEEKLEKIALYDSLTGCSTRETSKKAMEAYYAERQHFYICFADVNNLKPVNDNLGHDAGDRYLTAVSHALSDAAGDRDIVSRFGGDEFLLITPENGLERMQAGMDNARWALDELSNSSEYPFRLWVSYGIACSRESDTPEGLLTLADKRMYENKRKDKEKMGDIL